MALNETLIDVPWDDEEFDPSGHMRRMGSSLGGMLTIPVVSEYERGRALARLGWTPSAARPFTVYRSDLQRTETTIDGVIWVPERGPLVRRVITQSQTVEIPYNQWQNLTWFKDVKFPVFAGHTYDIQLSVKTTGQQIGSVITMEMSTPAKMLFRVDADANSSTTNVQTGSYHTFRGAMLATETTTMVTSVRAQSHPIEGLSGWVRIYCDTAHPAVLAVDDCGVVI